MNKISNLVIVKLLKCCASEEFKTKTYQDLRILFGNVKTKTHQDKKKLRMCDQDSSKGVETKTKCQNF